MPNNAYDLIVIGAGTAGVPCAIEAGKLGLKTLVLEIKSCLGGTQVGGLCTPMMNNISIRNKDFAGNSIFSEIFEILKNNNGVVQFKDNPFWFEPTILQKSYEKLLEKYNVDVLYEVEIKNISISKRNIISMETIEQKFSSLYYVDATGDASISQLSGVEFLENNSYQPPSLRFMVKNVNTEEFKNFLSKLNDPNLEEYNGLIYSHYTWDGNNSIELEKLVKKAVSEKIIELSDFNYIQFFSVNKTTLAFNAPRILIDKFNPNDKSMCLEAIKLGKIAIDRIFNFFKKNIIGFENAEIMCIAKELGIRDSNSIKGRYTLTKEDVLNSRKFDEPLFSSDYPIDIHSNNKGKSILMPINGDYYQAPIECARPENLDNLFVIGKCISATKEALGSARIQPNCIEMGEKVARFIAKEIKMSNLTGVSLMPHPPIIVPEIGKENLEMCKITHDSCFNLANDICKQSPELIVFITPHSQAYADAFSIYTASDMVLNFNNFGDNSIRVQFSNDVDFVSKLTDTNEFVFAPYQLPSIDHGAGVPLYFLAKAGYKGDICIINYSFESNDRLIKFGKHLKKSIEMFGKKTHLIASGDMSHRLLESGPYGFKQEGVEFDKFILNLIKDNKYEMLLEVDEVIRQEAGECGYNSLVIVLGAIDFKPINNKFYSYEAPFGVGYLVANL